MKLRHAAAFALVGWYLMVSPFTRKSYLGADIHAAQLGLLLIHPNPDMAQPLSKWQKIGQFDSEHDCHRALRRLEYEGEKPADTPTTFRWPVWGTARCIASDDPRLKP